MNVKGLNREKESLPIGRLAGLSFLLAGDCSTSVGLEIRPECKPEGCLAGALRDGGFLKNKTNIEFPCLKIVTPLPFPLHFAHLRVSTNKFIMAETIAYGSSLYVYKNSYSDQDDQENGNKDSCDNIDAT